MIIPSVLLYVLSPMRTTDVSRVTPPGRLSISRFTLNLRW
jgi:hypothetical protein